MDTAPPRIFDNARRHAVWERMLVRQQREDAARFVLDEMADDLAERVSFMQLAAEHTLLIGLPDRFDPLPGYVVRHAPLDRDEEAPLSEGGFDCIIAAQTLSTVNDLPGALLHLNRGLASGGVLLLSMVGAGSLTHLRRAMIAAEPDRPAARMHPLVDNRSATGLLERAAFSRFVVDSSSLQVAYRTLDRLVHDLRDQGLTNQLASRSPPLSRASLERARSAFLDHADADGRVVETFELLTLTGWKS